ncbi:hypothetical protein M407DRAFT_22795 [Tulasnella calospora MUT 4182]|uniref:Uncharacterized protein n=1 Tax=Tulasnella calospora MUT 4182 TaxID=1051891 RepID=A0A0C3QMF9_9AGAM|nr:hypothetical protein M407DRAFT_22795 [Tulasnella calospora MUT 4182]
MADPRNQPPSKSPVTSKSPSQLPTVDVSTHELYDKVKATRSAISTLLKDTTWPPESIGAVQSFLQTMSSFPELPAEGVPVKDDTEKFILVLEGAHTTVKKASDKYGSKERGIRDGIKYSLSSLRPSKCTNILQTCQDDIGKALTMLRSRFNNVKMIDSTPPKSGGPTETPASIQDQPNATQAQVKADLGSSGFTPSLQAESPEQAGSSENPGGHQASVPESPSDLPKDQDIRSPIRDGVITAARMTFKTVDTVSGSIPVVGDLLELPRKWAWPSSI